MSDGYLDGQVVDIRLHGRVRQNLRITRMDESCPPVNMADLNYKAVLVGKTAETF